jgi:NAD(P)-dependent dehydrogenase (short-subunit alcohol dehydrogenase family)
MAGIDHDDAFVMLVGAGGQGQSDADQERYKTPHHHSAAIHGSLRFDGRRGLDPVVDVRVVGGPIVSSFRTPLQVITSWSAEKDIAATVAFLAGPDGSWITGQTLGANGGMI